MPTRKRHPCVSSEDTHNSAKMHNFSSDDPEHTTCHLLATGEGDRAHGYTSLCPVCWPEEAWTDEVPPPSEDPWTVEGGGREGDLIGGRGGWRSSPSAE